MVALALDPHSLSNLDEVTPSHLDLELKVDFEQRIMHGIATWTLEYAKDSVNRIVLDTRDLHIESVTDGKGKALNFQLGDAVKFLGRPLIVTWTDQPPAQIQIRYLTAPHAAAVQWLSSQQTTSGKPFLFTQSQAILARTWIPCMDSPAVKTTYAAKVQVPHGFNVVMSASHEEHQADLGLFRFRMNQPIPSYLIALAIGDLEFRPISKRVGVYAEPSMVERAHSEFRDAEHMLSTAESLIGPYEWERWDILVLPPSFPFGGMENPRITFATPTVIAGDRSLVSLLAHELAHSWSGNLVTNRTWDDFWLNEGFTTYLEQRIMESLYGTDLAAMIALLGQADLRRTVKDLAPQDTRLKLDLKGRDADDGMTDVAYEKGANLLRLIEVTFGRKAFDAYLRGYFQRFKFKTLTTEDFLADIAVHLVADQTDNWQKLGVDAWIYQPGIPANILTPKSQRFSDRERDVQAFIDSAKLPVTADWATQEWLKFLNSLPQQLKQDRLDALYQTYSLDQSGNTELAFAWFMIAVRHNHQASYGGLERFLTAYGRRKFLRPLYEAMIANPHTQELAQRVYTAARPSYHSIAQKSIDQLFEPKGGKP